MDSGKTRHLSTARRFKVLHPGHRGVRTRYPRSTKQSIKTIYIDMHKLGFRRI